MTGFSSSVIKRGFAVTKPRYSLKLWNKKRLCWMIHESRVKFSIAFGFTGREVQG